MNIFPWQIETWKRLVSLRPRLPHAMLFHGQEGIGKTRLAQAYAQSLLCQTPLAEGYACGSCPACHWFAQGHHPDYLLIQSESMAEEGREEAEEGKAKGKPSRTIRIEQIRDMQDTLAAGSHQSGLRVILILPAEAMNASTANALLKSLEEPPPGTLFLLVSHEPNRLLPTVRSRCQAVAIPLPAYAAALAWLTAQGVKESETMLAYAGGAPLAALDMAESGGQRNEFARRLVEPHPNPILLADFCQQLEPPIVVGWMQQWVYDLARAAMAGEVRYHTAQHERIITLARAMDTRKLLRFVSELQEARALSRHTLNARLFFEGIFLSYRQLGASADE
jgi:DNA polymerase-3 subunit delta'